MVGLLSLVPMAVRVTVYPLAQGAAVHATTTYLTNLPAIVQSENRKTGTFATPAAATIASPMIGTHDKISAGAPYRAMRRVARDSCDFLD